MPFSLTGTADTNSPTSTQWLKNVSLYQPVSWSQDDASLDIKLTTTCGRSLALEPTSRFDLNSMADLTQAVSSGQLLIRSYDNGTNGVTDQVMQYPIVTVDTGTTIELRSPLTFEPYTRSNFDLGFYNLGYGGTGTGTITFGSDITSGWGPPRRTRTRGRSLVRRNHRGMQPRAVRVDFSTATPEEITALQLLRGLVGQDEFRRYLKYGFVMVRGASGLRYQIKRSRHVIDVWNERGRVDGICVYLQGQYPPTDDTITRMLMAERDELELWRRGNSTLGRKATLADLQQLYGRSAVAA